MQVNVHHRIVDINHFSILQIGNLKITRTNERLNERTIEWTNERIGEEMKYNNSNKWINVEKVLELK